MNLLSRLNVFWLGAGGFLALFCANEIVANHVSQAPLWLGGRMVYVASWVGLALGLIVMAFLGLEERPEPDADAPEAAPEAPATTASDPGKTPGPEADRTGPLTSPGS